jgi:hypothetical protein
VPHAHHHQKHDQSGSSSATSTGNFAACPFFELVFPAFGQYDFSPPIVLLHRTVNFKRSARWPANISCLRLRAKTDSMNGQIGNLRNPSSSEPHGRRLRHSLACPSPRVVLPRDFELREKGNAPGPRQAVQLKVDMSNKHPGHNQSLLSSVAAGFFGGQEVRTEAARQFSRSKPRFIWKLISGKWQTFPKWKGLGRARIQAPALAPTTGWNG